MVGYKVKLKIPLSNGGRYYFKYFSRHICLNIYLNNRMLPIQTCKHQHYPYHGIGLKEFLKNYYLNCHVKC